MDKFLMRKDNKNIIIESETHVLGSNTNESDTAESETEQEGSTSVSITSSDAPKMIKKSCLKRVRLYKFKDDWMQIPEFNGWLRKSQSFRKGNDMAHCSCCQVDIISHKNDITKHSMSARHKRNMKKIMTNTKINKLLDTPLDKKVTNAELKLSGLIATNNLPISLMDDLAPLCSSVFTDSEIAKKMAIKRTKTTKIIKETLGNIFSEKLYQSLKQPGCFFSIIMDETTDISVKKQCAYTVIYYNNEEKKTVTKFFDIVENTIGTAEGLYTSLKDVINNKNIPFSNLIGFSSDTTNVMVGEHQSVFALLKKDNPNVVCVKCSCHMIHLSACKACLQLPRSIEDLLRNIGSHFSRSSYIQDAFREFQVFFKTEIHKILSPSTTRWLSLKQCVDRVLEQYQPLFEYLRQVVYDDPSRTTEQMLETMNNKFTLIYLEFMSYTLGLLTDFNVLFQTESPLLYVLKKEVGRLMKNVCSNFLDMKFVRNDIFSLNPSDSRYFVPLENIYLGIEASESLAVLKKDENVQKQELDRFLKTCLQFYIELVCDIKKRFDFSDPIFEIINIVDPKEARSYKLRTLAELFTRFPILKDFVNPQEVDKEWRDHALLDFHELEFSDIDLNNAEKYWSKIFNLKNAGNKHLFKNLNIVMSVLLILPFSNASVERVFSELKNIKTHHRNQLHTDTIKAILMTKQGINESGGCVRFQPDNEMIARIRKK